MSDALLGQWQGEYRSDGETGIALMDLDQMSDKLHGHAFIFARDPNKGGYTARISLDTSQTSFAINAAASPVWVKAPPANSEQSLAASTSVTLHGHLSGDTLTIDWQSEDGSTGRATMKKSAAHSASMLPANMISWSDFQNEITELASEPYRYVFRGQSQPWRLRTAFHRTSRKDLVRYWGEDIPRLRHALTGKVRQTFRSGIPEEQGALMHLAQHHGFPTPLLDWSYSPFIAAFFALSEGRSGCATDVPARIYCFDRQAWHSDYEPDLNVTHRPPHISFFDPTPLGNDRAMPQQALAAITNVDDIESHIAALERVRGKKYLKAYDISPSERESALAVLTLMGITHGSLFPGIDGVCREYRERSFGPQPW